MRSSLTRFGIHIDYFFFFKLKYVSKQQLSNLKKIEFHCFPKYYGIAFENKMMILLKRIDRFSNLKLDNG